MKSLFLIFTLLLLSFSWAQNDTIHPYLQEYLDAKKGFEEEYAKRDTFNLKHFIEVMTSIQPNIYVNCNKYKHDWSKIFTAKTKPKKGKNNICDTTIYTVSGRLFHEDFSTVFYSRNDSFELEIIHHRHITYVNFNTQKDSLAIRFYNPVSSVSLKMNGQHFKTTYPAIQDYLFSNFFHFKEESILEISKPSGTEIKNSIQLK
ncbi:MAG: hypothetical protein R2799_05695 [Crocinitomicaceae bacterium]